MKQFLTQAELKMKTLLCNKSTQCSTSIENLNYKKIKNLYKRKIKNQKITLKIFEIVLTNMFLN